MAINNQKPNLYELQGSGVTISYTPAGLGGVAQLNFKDKEQDLAFRKDQVRRDETAIGVLVTVGLKLVPDFESEFVSVLIPAANLPNGEDTAIETLAVYTAEAGSIVGPALVRGQVQTYRTVALKGKARLVEF